ncbi:tRNA (guanosine(37)-N1)-methyltransferase TrmD [Thermobifida fusca]|jgi:tRNA (guanine37-N1)-methyltransferase|uniref:tRNA (guanine-N(1)-)-methyltransferase n=2 Tax=Thermobifida fusca TaxID=2021 RepID=TRMD_THEFY|nr:MULTISPECIES: tRNA (guanosine(37)-N1)-methyltransferase TrmD [Thermobifida]Q47S64.1 RecName: Full=tRNA (guanine-N(1)-)-methyltransferase; AltName: Full=M1G-methyltransferase; AltName: Full=tRNA [GM37] methyltransferase [Thermobifida fusca YX]AAZ54703.1 tRNA (Guanine37-N(1)-) methyltransferase [Thermobifida fusca YX]EOR72214.1 tRNA (guanine-N(1)-)-methyltransferase [Thermobifida fusca TM51]MBO2529438.1 tRNA (guanosine(37)-N1)-methyltransferase TrmD [Thermobifida sp.]MDD6792594.1 tRNA (guanos
MRIDIITIFPDYFTPLDLSLIGKARRSGLIDVRLHDLRRWTYDRHHTVDDTPYGGGPGMVMKPEPWGEALDEITADADAGTPRLILPTPSGLPFTQQDAVRLAKEPWLIFACGRYEGIDARVAVDAAQRMPVEELSIGDYVLNGGEVATLVIVEAISRLLPGVLGNVESITQDSFAPGTMDNLVEGPVYTKPPVWRGHEVPPILLSGHHAAIDRWRRDEALRKTARNRPDLIRRLDPESLDKRDREVLAEVGLQETSEPVAD